jgi:N4-gp56 family major capsid protein
LKQRDVLDAITTDRFSGGTTTATTVTAATLSDLRAATRELGRNSALKFRGMATGSTNIGTSPVRPSYWGICHVDNSPDLRALSGWVSVEQYGGYTDTVEGEIGTVEGIRFVETESAPKNDDAGTTSAVGFEGTSDILNDVYSIFILGREAHGSVGLDTSYNDEIYKSQEDLSPIELIQHKPGSAGSGDPFNETGTVAWKAWWAGAVLNEGWMYKIECLASDLA